MVFEHTVDPEHGDVVSEGLLDALGLRKPVGDATGTEQMCFTMPEAEHRERQE